MGELRHVTPSIAAGRGNGPEKRTTLRFDAQGRLAGHLIGTNQPIFIQNVGLGGFAAEIPQPLPAGSHIVRLTTPDHVSTLFEARNVYCRPARSADGTRRLSAGFEFIRPPQNVDHAIKSILQRVTELRLGV